MRAAEIQHRNKISSLKAHFNEGAPLPSAVEITKQEDNLKGTKHLLVDIPFKDDKNKVQRLKNFIEEIENNVIINDTSCNMMTGSQLRKEKQQFEQLYKLELALRSQKEQSGKYSHGVVSSKMYRDEITEDKKQSLIEQLEKEHKAATVTVDWQPNAVLCKRFGLMDPFRNKDNQIFDFNKNPNYKKGKRSLEFIDQNNTTAKYKNIKGDEFFYKIQRGVERNETLQKQVTERGNFDNIPSDSESGSDMDGIEESNLSNIRVSSNFK